MALATQNFNSSSVVGRVGYGKVYKGILWDGTVMLVYEFISRGTLRDWLNAKYRESLSFRMRLNVALDSAKGILYLHTEVNPPIFHHDIKTSNILIDSKLTAKVADFGL
ncbi:probable LRR receptor-like serine/threonine-protein kinase isoform X1 [Tanacetum coccineum]